MDSTTETKTTKTAALVTAGILAGAGIATLATLWLTRKGPFSGRELPLRSMLENCDEAARYLENRLLRTA